LNIVITSGPGIHGTKEPYVAATFAAMTKAIAAAPAHPWVLATLVNAEGSSYRRIGARLLVQSAESWFGTLSGGCLEQEIAHHATTLVQSDAPPRLLAFDTRRLYGCDGHIDVLIERLPARTPADNLLLRVGAELARRRSCVLRTVFAGDLSPLGTTLLSAVHAHETNVPTPGVFTETLAPPVRIILFGQGPEIPPLRMLCNFLGWDLVVLVGPTELPTDFIADPHTGALVCNHHFGRDLATLARVLPLGFPYVGLLGPRRRRDEILARLHEDGPCTPESLAALHAPAGLDLGGESPEEIALAVVAEARAVFAGRKGGFLRERVKPIHDRPLVAKS